MTIQERVVGSVTVLDLDGKLVLGDGDTLLKDKIHSLVFQDRKNIVLNMGGVAYVDSSGLGAIVASFVTAKNNGGHVKLLKLTNRLQDLLAIAKLLTVFDTFDTEAQALERARGGRKGKGADAVRDCLALIALAGVFADEEPE